MHAGLHSLATRAPSSATRTRVRWQPYNSLPAPLSSSSVSTRTPPTTYLNTPVSVSSSSPYSTPTSSFDSDRLKSAPPPPTPSSKDNTPSKHTKYALGLVDQAVKSLCEIWRSQDIPPVFLTTLSSSNKNESLLTTHLLAQVQPRNYLPSPISPFTQPSPPNPSPLSQCEQEPNCMFGARSNLVPIKGFVHEVLRRSRTSGCVLQTALCYLEAIRSKIPELAEQERSGCRPKNESGFADRIIPATPAEIEQDAELTRLSYSQDIDSNEEITMGTVKVSDISSPETKAPSDVFGPLPTLPSPLLCPRRAFLAALILASKFTQDKCYSNRAWAKLSGLPPREIGRCERALGDALDWRLWVGKTPAATQPPSSPAPPSVSSRSLVRCQSESNLQTPTKKTGFLVQDEPRDTIHIGNSLRRASTLPANAFSTKAQDSSLTNPPYIMNVEMPSLSMIPSENTQYPADTDISTCPSTELVDVYPQPMFSPCPSLSYSPSSTDSSSSGDRTVQMSSLDDMPTYYGNVAPLGSDSWPWLESPPSVKSMAKVSPMMVQPAALKSINGTRLGKPPPSSAYLASGPQVHIVGHSIRQDYPYGRSISAPGMDDLIGEPNSAPWAITQ